MPITSKFFELYDSRFYFVYQITAAISPMAVFGGGIVAFAGFLAWATRHLSETEAVAAGPQIFVPAAFTALASVCVFRWSKLRIENHNKRVSDLVLTYSPKDFLAAATGRKRIKQLREATRFLKLEECDRIILNTALANWEDGSSHVWKQLQPYRETIGQLLLQSRNSRKRSSGIVLLLFCLPAIFSLLLGTYMVFQPALLLNQTLSAIVGYGGLSGFILPLFSLAFSKKSLEKPVPIVATLEDIPSTELAWLGLVWYGSVLQELTRRSKLGDTSANDRKKVLFSRYNRQ